MDKKTPTEGFNINDAWNAFKVDYLKFVEWYRTKDDDGSYIVGKFEEDTPTAYTNKWNREQYKIQFDQDGQSKCLSGGKKLFAAIRTICLKSKCNPIDLGIVQINRIGSGFETDYIIDQIKAEPAIPKSKK